MTARPSGRRSWRQGRLLGTRLLLVALTAALMAWACAQAQASDAAGTFAKANRAYQEGRFDAAADGYRDLVAAGVDDPSLWYNLGNAYARQDDLGRARACYERTLRRAPRDADARANLATLKQKLADPEPDAHPLLSFARFFTVNELMVATSAMWLCSGVLAALWIRRRREAAGFRALVGLVLLLACGGFLALRMHDDPEGCLAVVTPPEVRLYEGAGRDQSTRGGIHAGTCVRVLRSEGDWREVAPPGGLHGWVRAEEIEII